MSQIIVVGGGAAGMTAAIFAAEHSRVLLVEKNDRLGKKLAITGKGRCNVTNNCDIAEVMQNIPRNPRFLYSAMNNFPPGEVMSFFESLGVKLKTERGKRVFPVSDRAGDIVNALEREVKRRGVSVIRENVRSLIVENGKCGGVNTNMRQIPADAVILATGGMSYPKTGSDGYGYEIARKAGHTVIPPRPSLSALVTKEKWTGKALGHGPCPSGLPWPAGRTLHRYQRGRLLWQACLYSSAELYEGIQPERTGRIWDDRVRA